MKWSHVDLHTLKEAPADAEIVSHQLMIRAGLIRKVAPGIFNYGNFAVRALRKFEAIIRFELDRRSCQEILLPMVQPAQLWQLWQETGRSQETGCLQQTGRTQPTGDELLKFKDRDDQEFRLGATHEEIVIEYIRRDVKSHRDLPHNFYQIQTKYRDDARPRFGLIRGREFITKDAYSFERDKDSALTTYAKMLESYRVIFDKLGVKYCIVESDAGSIDGRRTHQFQLLAEAGEDHLLVCSSCVFAAKIEIAPAPLRSSDADLRTPESAPPVRAADAAPLARAADAAPLARADFRVAEAGGPCPKCPGGQYKSFRGIEIGHLFYFGTKYSRLMKSEFLTATGDTQPIEMGRYSIGISRTIQAVIEQSHDNDGIIWPPAIAPFMVHLVVLDSANVEVLQSAEIIYRDLQMHGLDVFFDDRDERPEVKFKDADLIGLPIRIIVGASSLQSDEIEVVIRHNQKRKKVLIDDCVERVGEIAQQLLTGSLCQT